MRKSADRRPFIEFRLPQQSDGPGLGRLLAFRADWSSVLEWPDAYGTLGRTRSLAFGTSVNSRGASTTRRTGRLHDHSYWVLPPGQRVGLFYWFALLPVHPRIS